MSLFAELKRRNVFRVAAAYLVVGWLVLQIAGIVLGMISAPEWVGKAIIAMLLLGFVPVVAAAWVFEVGPAGIRRDDGTTPRDEGPQARRLDIITLGAVVALLLIMLWQYLSPAFMDPEEATTPRAESRTVEPPAPPPAAEELAGTRTPRALRTDEFPLMEISPRSIAVLPFANLSPDPENEYFADGIAEEILNVLARIEGLRVASRTSSFVFRDGRSDLQEVAGRLGVAHVLEGSVRRQDQRVRITTQLIDARSDEHLWSSTFDRQLVDIFAIQEEIAQAVADAMRSTLGIRRVVVQAPTQDLEAYELYLRGRRSFGLRGRALLDARDLLEQAVARDPAFAPAWGTLASINMIIHQYVEEVSKQETEKAAGEAAARALELDPEQPAGLQVAGMLAFGLGDRVGGYRLLRQAVEADPNDANGWLWLGLTRLVAGHLHAARDDVARARVLDPLSGIHIGWLGNLKGLTGDEAASAELLARARDTEWRTWAVLFEARLALARQDRAEAIQKLIWVLEEESGLADSDRAALELVIEGLSDPGVRPRSISRLMDQAELEGSSFHGRDVLMLEAHREVMDFLAQRGPAVDFRLLLNIWYPQDRPLRELPEFLVFAERIGLVDYWDEFGYPDFCRRVETPVPRLVCER
jgi:adenylate cyclase